MTVSLSSVLFNQCSVLPGKYVCKLRIVYLDFALRVSDAMRTLDPAGGICYNRRPMFVLWYNAWRVLSLAYWKQRCPLASKVKAAVNRNYQNQYFANKTTETV